MKSDPIPTLTSTQPDAAPLPNTHPANLFKLYTLFVRDTARLSDRRQALNAIYISVNSVLIGAVALLTQLSGTVSSVFLAVEVLIAVTGYAISLQWTRMIRKYQGILSFRFEKLRDMERVLDIHRAFKMYTVEAEPEEAQSKKAQLENRYGFSEIELKLPRTFRRLYLLGTILLLLISFAYKLGLMHALRQTLVHLLQHWGLPAA